MWLLSLFGSYIYTGNPSLTNKLFTLAKGVVAVWQETLPPMLKRCRSPSAVSFENYLVVASGANDLGQQLDIIQIFDGYQWAETPGPLMSSYFIKSAVLDGVWYLTGAEKEEQSVYYATLDSLIDSCSADVDIEDSQSLWKSLPGVPYDFYSLAVLGNRLVAIGGDEGTESPSSAIHAYSPSTGSWIHVANLPVGQYSTCAIGLPSGELMVVGGYELCPRQVYTGSIEDDCHTGIYY